MTGLARLALYARTARHLRWEQWAFRPLRSLQRRLPVPAAPAAPVNRAGAAALAAAVAAWPAHAGAVERARGVRAGRFRFLNQERELPEIDWGRRYVSHLWSYNLHYFDFAVDLAAAFRATGDAGYVRRLEVLATGWIGGTRGGRGDGWEPYALSLRTVNWTYALLMLGGAVHADARRAMEESLAAQLALLERRLERHILANHLQKNLKALVVGGLYFGGAAGQRWLRRGAGPLWRELAEQVLPDGTHYERSPMYHAIALADFLEVVDLLRAAGREVPAASRERVAAMADAFGVLCRPDGRLHLFNDAAFGVAPERAWLDAMARRVCGRGIPDSAGRLALPRGGYWGYADPAAGERLLADCGEPGPAYQPGHAHCDLLSFELDLAGRPVVVDAGTSGYGGDPLRAYQRSTRAHNTVSVGGGEQAETWGTFRMARRPVVRGAGAELEADGFRFHGAYSPYHAPGAVHRREIRRGGDGWTVTDRVEGAPGAPLNSYLHLHPDFDARVDGGEVVARAGAVEVRVRPFGVDAVAVHRGARGPDQGWYAPEFGVALPAPAVELVVNANRGSAFGYHIRTFCHDHGI